MPQYAVFLYAPVDDDTEPEPGAHEAHDRHADELRDAGATLAMFALEPYTTATSIRSDGSVTDGPFIEAKEVVLGFYVFEANDLDAALAVARRNPIIRQGGGVEVRPVAGGEVRSSS
ncbi:MAG TPA: YciI family protein [Acidimicrobiales bacterium]|jgi:hypothetical protein|nr:YciI family protein [Acidimicrobiales bacterium]